MHVHNDRGFGGGGFVHVPARKNSPNAELKGPQHYKQHAEESVGLRHVLHGAAASLKEFAMAWAP
jgi:hypothetical protein